MQKLLLIALGGAFGSVLRFLIAGGTQKLTDAAFPIGTMVVNVIGCLCIGVLGAMFTGPNAPREEYRLALMVGVLGGFTTFSAFGLETFELMNKGELPRATLNVVLTNAACLVAVWVGYRITERLIGA